MRGGFERFVVPVAGTGIDDRLLEVLMRTPWRTAYEVPYRVSEREADASKASLRQGVIFLRHWVRLLREIPAAGMFWKLGLAAGALVAITRLFRR